MTTSRGAEGLRDRRWRSTSRDSSAPTLTLPEARRGIYIDFEGRKKGAPVLLGVLRVPRQGRERLFIQYVLDRRFRSAVVPPLTEFLSFTRAVELIVGRAERRQRVIIGWSWHELKMVREHAPHLGDRFEAVYRDGKRAAQRWRSILSPDLEIERGDNEARHRLDVYAGFFGLQRPPELGPKRVGTTLGRLSVALEKAEFFELPDRWKEAWDQILAHNAYDCQVTRDVCVAALEALERRDRRPSQASSVRAAEPFLRG